MKIQEFTEFHMNGMEPASEVETAHSPGANFQWPKRYIAVGVILVALVAAITGTILFYDQRFQVGSYLI